MKIIVSLLIGFFLFTFTVNNLYAQKNEMTIILLRHAEKDTSPGADKVDPDLVAQGNQRATRLIEIVRKYKPTEIYSTNFKRTRYTVIPLAEQIDEKYRLRVQLYDHKKLDELASQILKSNAKTVVVVGHNNSTPALANLFIKQEKYKILDESEYSKLWIIKVKNNKVMSEEVIEY